MKAGVEYCEQVLWELIESGATASDSLGKTSYSDFLADAAKRGALEKGKGALVLSAPTNSLKSWFDLIARKVICLLENVLLVVCFLFGFFDQQVSCFAFVLVFMF
jgi:hypothetical protein